MIHIRPVILYAALIAVIVALISAVHRESKDYMSARHSAGLPNDADRKNSFSWQRSDTSIALLQDNEIVWKFNYHQKYDKPYFYPLRVAGQAHDLVWLSPSDHPWHRGLWFSWKIINEVNYWEEDTTTRLSEGRSKIKEVDLHLNEDYSAIINVQLAYAPDGEQPVLKENRSIFISAPDNNGNYYMDWDLKFTAGNQPVVFDRTLPPSFGGPWYGGYGGLSYRAAQKMTRHQYLCANGWEGSGELVGYGERGRWMDLSGMLDPSTQAWGGVTMFDHPTNPNSPSPWYVYKDQQFAFYNAALLFDKPLTLGPNSKMQLLYRVGVHEGAGNKELLNRQYQEFLISHDRAKPKK